MADAIQPSLAHRAEYAALRGAVAAVERLSFRRAGTDGAPSRPGADNQRSDARELGQWGQHRERAREPGGHTEVAHRAASAGEVAHLQRCGNGEDAGQQRPRDQQRQVERHGVRRSTTQSPHNAPTAASTAQSRMAGRNPSPNSTPPSNAIASSPATRTPHC